MKKYIHIVNKYFDKDDIKVIMEVGALDAQDSIFLKKNFPDATVYAIEWLPDNYEKYLKNLKNIKTFNMVIANTDGYIKYYVKNINGIHGIYDRGEIYGNTIKTLQYMKLSTLCKKNNINRIDMMKIDVEGANYDILLSMGELLKNVKIMHIETETIPFFKGQQLHDANIKLLTDNGFKLVELSACEIVCNGFQHDSVWINKKFIK